MTAGLVLFVLALAALLALSLFFIVCRRYEDGVVGNLALIFIAGMSAISLFEAWTGDLKLPPPQYYTLIVALAVFLVRHAYRFAMFHWHGAFGWGRPRDFDPDSTVTLNGLGRDGAR